MTTYEIDKILQRTDGRPIDFFNLLKERAKELVPDYPFGERENDAFEQLWALTSSLEGTGKACDDLHETIKGMRSPIHSKSVSEVQQAKAWSELWVTLVECGILCYIDPANPFGNGMQRAIAFVKHLKANQKDK